MSSHEAVETLLQRAREGVSPFNRVGPHAPIVDAPRFVDITLREGQQAARVAFSVVESVEIAQWSDQLGLQFVQAGFAGANEATFSAIKSAGVQARVVALVIALADSWREDIARAVDAGVDVLEILVRSGDHQLTAMGLNRNDALARTREAVEFAMTKGTDVWFGPSFSSHAEPMHLRAMYRVAADAGVTHFNIPDSAGVATPDGMAALVSLVKETVGGSVGVHCHNDFGLATANSIAAWQAGADTVDVSANGYGERAGNCPTDELVAALEILYGVDTGVNLPLLAPHARRISEMANVPLPPAKAISGSDVFAQKLEIHVKLTNKQHGLLEPFPPEVVGNQRCVRVGMHSGPFGIRAKAAELGLPTPTTHVAEILVARIEILAQNHQFVSDDWFEALLKEAQAEDAHA